VGASNGSAGTSGSTAEENPPEPQPGCSHWNQMGGPVVPVVSSPANAGGSGQESSNSGTASPQQRVSSSSVARIDWEGMYNDLFARNASLITRLQVCRDIQLILESSVTDPYILYTDPDPAI